MRRLRQRMASQEAAKPDPSRPLCDGPAPSVYEGVTGGREREKPPMPLLQASHHGKLSFEHGSWAEWLRAVPDTPPPLLNYYLFINACKRKMFVASSLAPYEAVKRLSSIPRNRSIPRFCNGMLHVRHVDRAARQNYISVLKIRGHSAPTLCVAIPF